MRKYFLLVFLCLYGCTTTSQPQKATEQTTNIPTETTTITQSTINENLDKYVFRDGLLSLRARRLWLGVKEEKKWQLELVGYRSRAFLTVDVLDVAIETHDLFTHYEERFDVTKHAIIPLNHMPYPTKKTIIEASIYDQPTVIVLYEITMDDKIIFIKATVEDNLFDSIRKEIDAMVASISFE